MKKNKALAVLTAVGMLAGMSGCLTGCSSTMSEEEMMIVEALQDCSFIAMSSKSHNNVLKHELVGDIEVIACSDIFYELPGGYEQPFFGFGEEFFGSYEVWYCMIEISDDEQDMVYVLLNIDGVSTVYDYHTLALAIAHAFESGTFELGDVSYSEFYSEIITVFNDYSDGDFYVPDGNDINVKHLNKALSE
ncbi:MAG: hypothetical protein LUF89_03855 [Ruminococcus sp.]|nr:hypothetical protein [Ruminococcus sp.]